MNREELKSILPHREPMLLLDEAFVEDGAARGRYKVRGDEFFLQGHFPGQPIVPGVILCEILAQSACVLLKDRASLGGAADDSEKTAANGAEKKGPVTLYTSLNNVRFRSPARPGDTIETRCVIKRVKEPFYFAEGTACVDGKVCVSAEFSFAVTEV